MSEQPPEEGPPQLKIDGGEVSSEQARRTSRAGRLPGLNTAQREILNQIHEDGNIRSVEAGVIIHSHREFPCGRKVGAGSYTGPKTAGRIGCCGYASADGLEAMKRLEKRGLVKRQVDGLWVAAR